MRKGNRVKNSIVRNGNHFLRFGVEWCLVSGPWWDYLERLRGDSWLPIRVWEIAELCYCDISDGADALQKSRFRELEWEPGQWHPGCSNPWGKKPPQTFREFWLQDRWHEYQHSRKRIGYRLLPDGQLPAHLRRAELPRDSAMQWELMSQLEHADDHM